MHNGFLNKSWTPEEEKDFWDKMKICKGKRSDGKDGECISPNEQNLGCLHCVVEAGLMEPKAVKEND